MAKGKDLIILGVCYNSDAGAVILKNGIVVAAINEERLNRKKLWYGENGQNPDLSIAWVLKKAGLTIEDVDYIVTHDGTNMNDKRRPYFEKVSDLIKRSPDISSERKKAQLDILWKRYARIEYVIKERDIQHVKALEQCGKPVRRIDHHLSHAASAYFTSGWDECYVMTADGWGGDGSSGLFYCKDGYIDYIARSEIIDSLGYYYGSVTKYLGFTPHKHEGKVLGLSAHGDPDKLGHIFMKMISFDPKQRTFRGLMENGLYVPNFDNPWLQEALGGRRREDIAAGVQRVLEEVVLDYIKALVPSGSKLCLAGGIFANVLLNQKILSLPSITHLHVFPHMGDGGLALGAALYHSSLEKPLKPYPLDNVYWGPDYGDEEIRTVLDKFGVKYEPVSEIEDVVARLLADGQVVARFNGRMEYGPRALGNRSILYRPDDPSVNDWLNHKLKRTEFMPFAPATLHEHASRCYHFEKNIEDLARFMTITADCTDEMKKTSPGVVHIDGTARPQLVKQEQNPSYYRIIERFHELTGNPSIINTSFNMHEEPIVCSPSDAVRAFLDSQLPYLAIGNFLVSS